MTREEAIDILRCRTDGDAVEALEMAIQALEQEPCEDTISRQNDILPNIDKEVENYKKLLKHPVVKHIIGLNEEQEQLDFVQSHKRIPVTLTVESGDCISRQQAKAYLYDRINRLDDDELYDIFSKIIDDMVNELPPVKPQEPKYCDRNICIKNEYNGISCDECEVTKSQQPKTGHWILQPSNKEQGERDFIWWKCSECGQVIYSETEKDRREYHAFCGRCGANMSQNPIGSKDVIWYSKRNYSEIVVEPQERSE